MHYGRFDFSIDPETRPTIILKKPYTGPFSDRLGQRINMTEIDSYQLRLLYNCPSKWSFYLVNSLRRYMQSLGKLNISENQMNSWTEKGLSHSVKFLHLTEL